MVELNSIFTLVTAKIRRIKFLLRRRPFDTSTEQGRADERHRRIVLTAFMAAGAKGVSALTGFISLPLTWSYLNDEQQGMWQTFSQVIVFLGFADLGLGAGLLNYVSEAHARQNQAAARQAVSSAFFMLLIVALSLFALFSWTFPDLNVAHFLKLKSPQAIREAGPSAVVCALCFTLSLPCGIVHRIQLGHQEGFVNSVWSMAGNIVGLFAVLIAISCHAGLPWLVLALAGGPVVALLLNGIILFYWQRPWLRPHWRYASLPSVRSLLRSGSFFFIIQMAASFAYCTDNLIIGPKLGQVVVAHYSAVAKMFTLGPMLMEMFLSPLWPAYNEAQARGDFYWIKRTLLRSLKWVVIGAFFMAIILIIGGGPIVRVWTHQPIYPTLFLLVGFGLWTILAIAGIATAMFLNGTGAIRFQARCAIAMGLTALIAKYFFCGWFGPSGVVWATVLSYLCCIALPMSLYVPGLLRQMRTQSAQRSKTSSCG